MDLCIELSRYGERNGYKNFVFRRRFGYREKDKWSKHFARKCIKEFKGNIARIWVCGPPKMNEDFDKGFEMLSKEFSFLTREIYDVL